MGFYSSEQKRKLLLLLLLRRRWIQSKQKRAEGRSADFSQPSTSSSSTSQLQTLPSEDDLEYKLLYLKKEKLLLEMQKLSLERESIAAQKRNLTIQKEMLLLQGAVKSEPLSRGLTPDTFVEIDVPEEKVVRKRELEETGFSDQTTDVKIRKSSFDEDTLSFEQSLL